MSLARQSRSELVLVPSERHVEVEAARGARALTLRDFVTRAAEFAAPSFRAVSRETTRLLTRRELGDSPAALALAVDDALGELRRAGTRAEDLLAAGSRGALLARALRQTDARLTALGLRDERASAWLAARALAELSLPELDAVTTVRLRGISRWDNGELALIEALHRKLRARSGAGVVVELPDPSAARGTLLSESIAGAC
ncbi:MAG TPA: hypothetical protein VHV51_13840, partial [Polyangiaceae bacterium]|nr:hypothetical protein [Polyangiaceae bacterium]